MSALKLNSQRKQVFDDEYKSGDLSFLKSVHPEILKLLLSAKMNNKFLGTKAYLIQDKISYNCVSKGKEQDCILINKKAC